MANISGAKDWTKYVINNSAWNTTDFPIENNVVNEPVYQSVPHQNPKNITINGYLNTGDIVKLVTSTKTQGFRRSNYVNVKSGSLSGYIRATTVRKPTARGGADAENRHREVTNQIIQNLEWISGIGRGSRAGIDIDVPGIGMFIGITSVEKETTKYNRREPKADFYLKNALGSKILFISHKDGDTPTHFSQYGGISVQSGTRDDPALITNNPEVVAYTNELYRYYADGIGPRQIPNNPFNSSGKLTRAVYRELNDPQLIGQSVFGPEYGGAYSPENCHLLGQGQFIFKPMLSVDDDLYFELSFSGHTSLNGDISHFTDPTSGYRAALITSHRTGRNTTSTQGTIPQTRTGIYPRAYRSNAMAI